MSEIELAHVALRNATTKALNTAYTQRAIAAVGMAKMAILAGCKAGVGVDDNDTWEDEWRVVLYIDTPKGQMSWHIAPQDQHLLEGLPEYTGEWDGTFNSRDGATVVSL